MAPAGLIGRDGELEELERRTRTHRLVTVVGPGGVGKTALARAAAGRVGPSFPLGVRHVDLTRIDDHRAVPGALADQLGFDSFDALLSSPNDRPLLLVVDNCEHLLDAAAAALAQVLGACHQPTVVATSRSPLELPGESVLSLAPLALPAAADGDALACPSVQLFLERCRDAGAAHVAELGADDLPLVVELCRRLDGLPLALEIAAARARTLSIAEIAARLDGSVDVLERPRYRGDPRHRSVADTVRWSYDLLSPGAAALFERLAVFAGAFPASAARALTANPEPVRRTAGGADDAVERDLDELVHASLVSVDTSGTTTRYRLLDTVRRFALAQLDRRGALGDSYDRFVDQVIARSVQAVAGASASWRPGLLRELVGSFDDLAEALRWCNAHDATPERAHLLCGIFWAVVHQARADDVVELTRATLDRWPDARSPAAAQAVASLATAEYVTGHPERAVALAERTLAELDRPGLASVTLRRVLGQARRAIGDSAGALAAFRAGAAVGHELRMAAMAMELEVAAAQVLADDGQVEQALEELTAVAARAAAIDSAMTECWARSTQAWVMLRVDPRAALALVDVALAQARRIDFPIAVAVNLRSRAFGHLLLADVGAAAGDVGELLDDLLARGALSNARVLADVAAALAHRARHPWADALTASARSLPITTMAAARFELIELPDPAARPVPRHDVFGAVRSMLADLAAHPPHDADPPAGPAAAAPPSTAAPAVAAASIRRLGDHCELCFDGRTIGVRRTKGIDDVTRLVEAAGRELHCLDLLGAEVEQRSTGEVIDAPARRRYEDRIRELQGDIDEAEANGDYARSYRHQVELDQLIEHLTAALGHGGTTRRASDSTERARSAVTHRIRGTIRQLSKLHPSLGQHLERSITTGAWCSYRPEQPRTWHVD